MNQLNKFKSKLLKYNKLIEKQLRLSEKINEIDIEIRAEENRKFEKPIYMVSKRYNSKLDIDIIKIKAYCTYENEIGYQYDCLNNIGEDTIKIYSDSSWFVKSVKRDYKIVTKEDAIKHYKNYFENVKKHNQIIIKKWFTDNKGVEK